MEDKIWKPNQAKNFELVGVDIWNGSASELAEFQFVTQVKFPLLQRGGQGDLPWGLGTDNIIVVGPDGIVRLVTGSGSEAMDEIATMVDLINDPAPLAELKPKSLYFGRTGKVGQPLRITVKVENKGLETLEVTDIKTATDDVAFDRTAFTVEPGETETFVATLDPTSSGSLRGSVEVVTNDRNWTLDIPSIEIEGKLPPSISIPTASVDYGTVEVGRSHTRTIEIRNDGLGPLEVSDLVCDLAGVSFSERTFTVAAGETKVVTVTVQPSSEGVIAGAIDVVSDDPDRGTLSVNFSATGQVIPANPRTDFDGNGTIDFADFLGFAAAFGTTDVGYDVDQSGIVDFTDFLTFVENYGRSVATP